MDSAVRSLAAGLVGVALACNSGAFVCNDDEQCSADGVSGTCEATGWCSFPDGACESGSRYGDHAGGSLAGECVPADIGTSGNATTELTSTSVAATTMVLDGSSDSSDPTTIDPDSSSDPSVGESSSSGGASAVCGNGMLEDGEECDDSNMRDGDGCSAACIAAGGVLWEIVEDGPTGLADGAASIDIDASDALYVGAWFSEDDGPTLTARKVALDGTITWSRALADVLAWDSIYAWGIAVDGAGNAVTAAAGVNGAADQWVIAQATANGDAGWLMIEAGEAFGVEIEDAVWACGITPTGDPRVVGYALDGTEVHRHEGVPSLPSPGWCWDIAIDGDAVIVVGEVEASEHYGFATRLDPTGQILDAVELESQWTQALAIARGASEVWVVGRSDPGDGGWLARGSIDFGAVVGPEIVTPAATSANLDGVAFGPDGGAVVVGWQDNGTDTDALVMAYAPDATLVWSRTYEGGQNKDDRGRDVVIASDGTIVVAGHIGPLTDEGDFWLFAVSP
ncbi:MAG TPA: hypothetical protein VG755_20755 [Nannocystaceae bacterium]|nr:hypothetical protein [Nannocystaceae bacterium]